MNTPSPHTEKPSAHPGGKPQKSRPTETLPTDRIAFPKQLNLLIAYGAIYEQTSRAVSNEEAGEVVGLSAGTTSLANAFFADVGFLVRAEGGYVPSSEVIQYRRTQEWDPDAAPQELAPLLAGTWFAQALLPKLALGPLSEQAALTELGKRANASTQYRPQLRTLIEYLVTAGVISQEGDQLRRVSAHLKPAGGRELPKEEPKVDPIPRKEGAALHPFVQGLLQELPPPGSVWAKADQDAWIAGWKVAFGFIYKTDGDSAEAPPQARATQGGESH